MVLYKAALIALAAVLGYWLDRALFYARPDGYLQRDWRYGHRRARKAMWTIPSSRPTSAFTAAMLRRAISGRLRGAGHRCGAVMRWRSPISALAWPASDAAALATSSQAHAQGLQAAPGGPGYRLAHPHRPCRLGPGCARSRVSPRVPKKAPGPDAVSHKWRSGPGPVHARHLALIATQAPELAAPSALQPRMGAARPGHLRPLALPNVLAQHPLTPYERMWVALRSYNGGLGLLATGGRQYRATSLVPSGRGLRPSPPRSRALQRKPGLPPPHPGELESGHAYLQWGPGL